MQIFEKREEVQVKCKLIVKILSVWMTIVNCCYQNIKFVKVDFDAALELDNKKDEMLIQVLFYMCYEC